MALFDSTIAWLANVGSNYLVSGRSRSVRERPTRISSPTRRSQRPTNR